MAKMMHKLLKNLSVKNAPSAGRRSNSGGVGGSFNRDPKAVKVKRIGYQLSNAMGGGRDSFEQPDVDFTQISNAIRTDSYIMQAVMRYTELIFKSGYILKAKNEQALEYLKTRLNMMAIATEIPTDELWRMIGQDIVRYSNCFLVKSRDKKGTGLPPGIQAQPVPPAKAPVSGYFRLPPQTVQISRDQNGTIKKYRQEVQGEDKPIDFRPEDVIHIKVNAPSGKAFGDPFLASVLDDVRMLRKIEEHTTLMLYRHIFPLLTYTIGIADRPGMQATDEELEEFRAVIEDMPTDGAIVLPERHKVEAVKIEEIDVKPYLEYFENRVFSGLGLSQVDYGRGDTANRNTADAMTGIKADRVKGWQQEIATQITYKILEELLVEGGFDPIVNPDFRIEFEFHEIELERKIAKETHEIFKFNNNAQTWEETRQKIGMDPVADESRLHYQMIGMSLAEHNASLNPSNEADNKNQPENQNGKRSGPKRSTESIHEQYFNNKMQLPLYNISSQYQKVNDLKTIDMQEKVFDRTHVTFSSLTKELLFLYRQIEQDTISELKRQQKRKSSQAPNAKSLLSSMNLGRKKIIQHIQQKAIQIFNEGIDLAKEDAKESRYPKMNTDIAKQTIKAFIEESVDRLKDQLITLIQKKLNETKEDQDQILAVRNAFQSLRFKNQLISKSILARSYNYGYALTLINYDYSEARVLVDEEACQTCKQHENDIIALQQLSSLDEVAVFYKIPPWHPNCECEVKASKL